MSELPQYLQDQLAMKELRLERAILEHQKRIASWELKVHLQIQELEEKQEARKEKILKDIQFLKAKHNVYLAWLETQKK